MTLIVTNGSSAAAIIRETVQDSTVISWDDVLHEGPVPATTTLDELSDIRADFLTSRGWGNRQRIRADLARRDNALINRSRWAEVCLMFEHDLYDQLQLAQVLNILSTTNISSRVTIACRDRYLGEEDGDSIRTFFDERIPVSVAMVESASGFWRMFISTRHDELADFESPPLPFMERAAIRILEEYPSIEAGLARSRQQILESLSEGPRSAVEIFRSTAAQEEARYLGDGVFAGYLIELCTGVVPLVEVVNGSVPEVADSVFGDYSFRLTSAGRAVRTGDEDNLTINGVDRWIGGVHLQGPDVPRWDGTAGRMRDKGGGKRDKR